ncbi:hypothetical protein [Synechocystis sp. CACIAM 05]|uniref:hypothetical protein n=1 Tax=Synechocystis sp. CACIAM 05 TaxID=1933929 RepID=UPI00138E6269|nr:hypothetical protein [Synechocystis sp. CACIAM 05]QHV00264.1 hypothetical protein BWK47_09070 [Synechocystis sp. CACIAM 05]
MKGDLDTDTIRNFSSILSPLLSGLALFFTRKFWLMANRPIISVNVETESSGNINTMYNLVVYNSGNRPAINIQLKVKEDDLEQIFCERNDANKKYFDYHIESIKRCFNQKTMIPLILNGKSISNSFGLTGQNGILIYKSQLPIKITYQDLDGRKYSNNQKLLITTSEVFADGQWT